jgi:hypothetical protein
MSRWGAGQGSGALALCSVHLSLRLTVFDKPLSIGIGKLRDHTDLYQESS